MTQKILVVDDEVSIANVVALKLRRAGFEVIVALDGQEAYEQALASRPDVLITDLQMPRLNGIGLCSRLTEELGSIPTILLTAKGFEIDRSEIAGLPIRRIMTKPFSPRELLAQVQETLGLAAPAPAAPEAALPASRSPDLAVCRTSPELGPPAARSRFADMAKPDGRGRGRGPASGGEIAESHR